MIEHSSTLERTSGAHLVGLVEGRIPDSSGRFGPFGGRFAPEILVPSLLRLETEARSAFDDLDFRTALAAELHSWVGRPTPLTSACGLSRRWKADVWLKREDLTHTGAHKINNAIGQALLARRIGAKRVVAETGAGQHGVAAAAACGRVGIHCTIYMGAIDVERQAPNVDRIRQLGAELVRVNSGDQTLRAAVDETIRDWVGDPEDTYYLLGSVVGPHPYPWLVREFQRVIGVEAREQIVSQENTLPDLVAACVGGGSNAIGLFHSFLADESVRLLGLEAGGTGTGLGEHAATLRHGSPGVLHGSYSMLLQDEDGQVRDTHSISAGLDYPGVGPEHAFLQWIKRATYETVSDSEAMDAANECSETEGILPALESAHALAGAKRWASRHPGKKILVGLSGRGDKDLATIMRYAAP